MSFSLFSLQAELKTLQETASPSFSFANDLIKHNLVSSVEHCDATFCFRQIPDKFEYLFLIWKIIQAKA